MNNLAANLLILSIAPKVGVNKFLDVIYNSRSINESSPNCNPFEYCVSSLNTCEFFMHLKES